MPPTALFITPTGLGGSSEAYRSRAKNQHAAEKSWLSWRQVPSLSGLQHPSALV